MRAATVNKSVGQAPRKQIARLFEFSDSRKIRVDEPKYLVSTPAKVKKEELNLPPITSPRARYQDADVSHAIHKAAIK